MEERSRLLIVDDNKENVRVLIEILKRHYQLNATTDGLKAVEIAKRWNPDVILLDVVMPNISGYDICMELRANEETKDTPIIFATAISTAAEEVACIKLGALDYVTKPVDPALLSAKIKNFIEIKNDRNILSRLLKNRRKEIDLFADSLLADIEKNGVSSFVPIPQELAAWGEHYSAHIKRCVLYAKILIKALLKNVYFSELIDDNLAEAILTAVIYHDIGKTSLSLEALADYINAENGEFNAIKNHVILDSALTEIVKAKSKNEKFAKCTLDIIRHHHERWDGTGYPDDLKGKEIPLGAQIMALADQYDVLIGRRLHKESSYHFEAVRIISSESGKGFDPELVREFLSAQEEFTEVLHQYADCTDFDINGGLDFAFCSK